MASGFLCVHVLVSYWFRKKSKTLSIVAAALAVLLPAFPVRRVPPSRAEISDFMMECQANGRSRGLACSSSSSSASTADGESIARTPVIFDALPFVEGQLPVRVILVVDGAHALASFSSWLNML